LGTPKERSWVPAFFRGRRIPLAFRSWNPNPSGATRLYFLDCLSVVSFEVTAVHYKKQ